MAEHFRRQGLVRPREGRVIAGVCVAFGAALQTDTSGSPGTEAYITGRSG